MILDYNHKDLEALSPSEREKMEQGKCPKCENDKFRLIENELVRWFDGKNDYIECEKCEHTMTEDYFSPEPNGKFV